MSSQEPKRQQHDWDEETWERFFRREDARMAKFKELFDTLGRSPEREKIIMRELGLAESARDCPAQREGCSSCARRHDCEVYEMCRLFEWPDNFEDDPEAAEILASFEEVKRLPAYQKAHSFSLLLQEYFGFSDDHEPPRWAVSPGAAQMPADRIWTLLDAAATVPAQIAGGHGIGYEPDCICGNIASCKRALANVARCEQYMREIDLPSSDAGTLFKYAEELCAILAGWIEQLRHRARDML